MNINTDFELNPDSNFSIDGVLTLLKCVSGSGNKPSPLHEPLFAGKEWEYVKDCLDTGMVSSIGKYVLDFEEKLTQYTGVNHAVAVVNGTAALHICLLLAGVKQGDEVLLPALTFVATANAVHYCGAVPHFVDSDARSLGVNPEKLEDYLREIAIIRDDICYNGQTMRPVRAIVAMHAFGHPVDIDPLTEVCQKYKLTLIEDAAEALGSYYKNRHVGGFGKLSSLSFNGNKIVTAGGGGAVLTNDPQLAQLAKHLSTTAKLPHPWAFFHDRVGYNYRLPNINAALGCAQMGQIGQFVRNKRALAEKYRRAFSGLRGIAVFTEPEYAQSNYWLNVLLLDEGCEEMRDRLLSAAHDNGILARPAWVLLNRLPMYRNCPHMDMAVAESLERRIINIPSSACLGA